MNNERNDVLEEAARVADQQAREDRELIELKMVSEHAGQLAVSGAEAIARRIRSMKDE